jgi:hypothetical protein
MLNAARIIQQLMLQNSRDYTSTNVKSCRDYTAINGTKQQGLHIN